MEVGAELVVFDHVTKAFGTRVILDDISFTLHKGEIFGLIGPSGAGKTTILRTLIGFYPPEAGRVLFEGKQVKRIMSKYIGFATQDECFYEDLSCDENMRYFGTLYSMTREDIDSRIPMLLDLVELGNARHLLGRQLSGGMRRRLDIAIALLHNPRILILDEPTSGLDPVLRKHLLTLIERIRDAGISIIITSHLLEELEQICNNVAIIFKGKFVALGNPQEITQKFFPYDEVHLVTYPGNYGAILRAVQSLGVAVSVCTMEQHQLRLATNQTEQAVYAILRVLPGLGEHLLDIDVMKPTLSEVFERLVNEVRRDQ